MDILGEIAAAHRRGRLVPFIGSGLSRPVCRNWSGMIGRLEVMAGVTGAGGQDNAALVRRAALALDRLRLGQGRLTAVAQGGDLRLSSPAGRAGCLNYYGLAAMTSAWHRGWFPAVPTRVPASRTCRESLGDRGVGRG